MFNQLDKPLSGETIAVMHTNYGDMKIRLFAEKAPKTVENFVQLTKKGYYNGIIFHRVIKDFMIQGGDPTGTGRGGESIYGEKFNDEFDKELHNLCGSLSMANAGPNTNGSQFFIVQCKELNENLHQQMKEIGGEMFPEEVISAYEKVGGTPWLDFKHSVFGQVYEGLDIVDKIAECKVDMLDKPFEDIKIESIDIETIE